MRYCLSYKAFPKLLEQNRCLIDNPAFSPLFLVLWPPSPYFPLFSSTEFLEKGKTKGAASGKTSLFLVWLWSHDCVTRTAVIDVGPACLPTLIFFFSLLFLCRKDQNVLSPVNCWNLLLNQVKRESRDHTTLSDIYLNNIIPRFVQVSEDSGRLFKKVKSCF